MLGERHPGARQFPFVSGLSRGDPDRGQLAEVLKRGQPLCVQLVGLVDVAHHPAAFPLSACDRPRDHDLGLGGVGQQGQAAGRLDLVDDPIPIPDTLQGDRSTFRQALQEASDRTGPVIDTGVLGQVAMVVE